MSNQGPDSQQTIIAGAEPLDGPQPNERYGDYEVIKPLASGGMADIFLARKLGAQGFQKLVVIKRIRRDLIKPTDTHMIDMFIDEANVAAKLDHPNVVVVSDLGEIDNSYFMAMEYLRGQTLRALQLRVQQWGQLLQPQLWARIMEYALDGLHYAHELVNDDGNLMGLVHRDFTPSNIMITYAGTVKVIDFGVARVEGPQRHETKIGTLKGKISYMSPEQVMGTVALDRRTDVFAAGIVLWELLSGKQLFDGPSETAILVEILQGTVPSPTWGGHPLDRELHDIVMKALARDVNDRFQSAAEMRDALREYLRHHPGRVDASDIAALMTQYFEQEKTADDRLTGKGETGARSNPGTRRGESVSKSRPGSGSISRSSVRGQQTTNPAATQPPKKRAGMFVVGGAAAVLLGGGIGGGIYTFTARPTHPPQAAVVQPKPEAAKPEAAKPEAAKPEAAKPEGTEPKAEAAKPEAAKPEAAKPEAAKPEAVAEKGPDKVPAHKNPAPKNTAPASETTGGFGLLDFDTRPYTVVYLGKKKIGETPMIGVKVPAGKLNLTLVNEEAGIKESYEISVPKDGHVSKKLKL